MTAYQLRRHLAAQHHLHMTGANFETLALVHQVEHQQETDHHHEVGE